MRTRICSLAGLGMLLATATALPVQAGDSPLLATLKPQQGKTVTLVLDSGTELTGKLAEVDAERVRLAELSGKEFFDAVVDLDQVQAVIFRARGN